MNLELQWLSNLWKSSGLDFHWCFRLTTGHHLTLSEGTHPNCRHRRHCDLKIRWCRGFRSRPWNRLCFPFPTLLLQVCPCPSTLERIPWSEISPIASLEPRCRQKTGVDPPVRSRLPCFRTRKPSVHLHRPLQSTARSSCLHQAVLHLQGS